MSSMTEDLLSRIAVDRNLERLARTRMKGRKLVGVKYDSVSKTWFAFLGDTLVQLRRHPASAARKARTVPPPNPSRKK